MAKINLQRFRGIMPKIADDKLPEGHAQQARNSVLETGEIRALKRPSPIVALGDIDTYTYKSLFEWIENSTSHWVYAEEDIDWVRSPIANDSFERLYYTGYTNLRAFADDIISGGGFDFTTDYYEPGAPSGGAPTLSHAAAGADYRAYYYTYVSRYGEEGPASTLTETSNVTDGAVMQINDIDYPSAYDHLITPSGASDVNRPKIRVYRTATDGADLVAFLLVLEAEWFDTAHTYAVGEYVFYGGGGTYDLYKCTSIHSGTWNATNFTQQGEDVADADLDTVNTSANWDACPTNAAGLIGHPNGFLVAFKGNEVLFSEPYYPHAWPTDYAIPIDQEIIGLGLWGTTVVVLTDGNVYTLTGGHPTAMYKKKLSFYPCLSKRGIVNTEFGVIYPASVGFMRVREAEVENTTEAWFRPGDLESYYLSSMHGTWFEGTYYGFFKTVDADGGLFLNYHNENATDTGQYHQAGYVSIVDGEFKTIYTSNPAAETTLYISDWEGNDESYFSYTWFSQKFVDLQVRTMNVARVILDDEFVTTVLGQISDNESLAALNATAWLSSLNAALNSHSVDSYSVNGDTLVSLSNFGISQYVYFELWADNEVKFTKQLSNSRFFKLPRGFQSKKWEVKVTGYIPIKRIEVASSLKELLN